MPRYSYTAKSFQGEEKTGVLMAKSKSELARVLKTNGLILVSAKEPSKKKKLKIEISFLKGISSTEKLMFTRNLGVMISAGVALPRSLEILARQTKNQKFRKAILNIEKEIIKGTSFSDALALYPDIFPEFFSSMIKVGEAGGTLREVLDVLTRHIERKKELASRITGAMIYPIVIIVAMLGIGLAMLLLVVPKISETFVELGIELPASTRFVIWLGTSLMDKWYLFIAGIVILILTLLRVLKTKAGKKVIGVISLYIPLVSSITKKTNSASVVRTLSSLIASGVPLTRSLEILSGTLSNFYYQEAMREAAEEVRKGIKLSEILAKHQNIFSTLVIQMVAVGEETGETSSILDKLATFLEEEVANTTENLAAVIEPIVMLLIGGAVGFFAISMIQPMYSMLGAVQ